MTHLSFTEAKQISIVGYLSAVGFEPAKIRGHDYWYHAPGRPDKEPSFKVNANLNLWYDHGEGEGGTIIELGVKLHGCTPFEFLKKLSEGNFNRTLPPILQEGLEKGDNKIEILTVSELNNTDLIFYLNQRGIDDALAKFHCKEIAFSIKGKSYRAIGFPNRSGGWELRNAWFKGSSSPKDITFIAVEGKKLAIAEGFIDYLSLLKIDDRRVRETITQSNILILNSLSFLSRSYDLLKCYHPPNLFLDNDTAGEKAKAGLTANGIPFNDCSAAYEKHKDANEFLIQRIREKVLRDINKSKGMTL